MPQPARSLSATPRVGIWQTIESTTGAFFAFAVGFIVIIMSINFIFLTYGSREFPVVLTAAVPLAAAELWWLARLKHALERGLRPLAPGLALSQPRWPLFLRPVVFTWWLAHYAVGIGAVVLLERYYPLTSTDWRDALFRWSLYAGCMFTTTHSAHLYLLLAVGSTIHRPGPVEWLWRWRIGIDLLIACTVAAGLLDSWLPD